MRTPEVIENERVEVLKQINTKREQLNVVSMRIHELERELLELKENKRKGRFDLSVLGNKEEILRSEFWNSRK